MLFSAAINLASLGLCLYIKCVCSSLYLILSYLFCCLHFDRDLCENRRRLSESGKSENLRDDSGDNDDGNDDNVIAMLS